MTNGEPKTANDLAAERTELAVDRTVMAANRSLMAWVRTALSLISFGFTIYKVLETAAKDLKVFETATKKTPFTSMQTHGPRNLGLFLIALGTMSVIFGTIEYFDTLKRLDKLSRRNYKPFNYSLLVGIVIGLLGFLLFVTILIHKEIF